MSRFNHKKEYSAQEILLRVLCILACTAIAVLFIPRTQSEAFDVSVDHPWRYHELIASSEFPIYKSEARIKAEQDSVRKLFEPYFTLLPGKGTEQSLAFRDAALRQAVPGYYRQYVVARLQEAYARGIVSADDMASRLQRSRTVRVVTGNESGQRLVSQLLTPMTAYEYVMKGADSTHYSLNVLQSLNLQDYITPNLAYDRKKSEDAMRQLMSQVPVSSGKVMAGTKIIGRGDIVTEEKAQIIRSYMRDKSQHMDDSVEAYAPILGQSLFVASVFTLLLLYFDLFRRDYMDSVKSMAMLATFVVSFPLITYSLVRHNIQNMYIVPYSMLPVFVRIFMDSRTAFISHAAMLTLSAVALAEPFEFIVIGTATGLVAIYSLRELSERGQMVRTAFNVTVSALVVKCSFDLMSDAGFGADGYMDYTSIAVGGCVLLFAYPLLLFVEKIFGFTSNVTLVELSNVNTTLLRRMTEEAPGTFQHSMQVANLASEVALKIGAKSQLVRTGALYHDIGKIENAAFFTENQRGINPHDSMRPQQSAQIITGHVRKGLELADQYRLPKVIKDFIATHHGCGRAKYFYIQAKNSGEDIDPAAFSYPGPNPTTLEQAILMMADAVEAASRSLKEYTDQTVNELVDRIVDGQVEDGYFTQCPITFRDIADAKLVFKTKLRTIYHTRIEYPKERK